MSGLTDFLLARIGEDEAVARKDEIRAWAAVRTPPVRHRARRRRGILYMVPVTGPEVMAQAETSLTIVRPSARVLAECRAKRQIVDHAQLWAADGRRDHYAEGVRYGAEIVLYQLVQPYAAHPDFDPAWLL